MMTGREGGGVSEGPSFGVCAGTQYYESVGRDSPTQLHVASRASSLCTDLRRSEARAPSPGRTAARTKERCLAASGMGRGPSQPLHPPLSHTRASGATASGTARSGSNSCLLLMCLTTCVCARRSATLCPVLSGESKWGAHCVHEHQRIPRMCVTLRSLTCCCYCTASTPSGRAHCTTTRNARRCTR